MEKEKLENCISRYKESLCQNYLSILWENRFGGLSCESQLWNAGIEQGIREAFNIMRAELPPPIPSPSLMREWFLRQCKEREPKIQQGFPFLLDIWEKEQKELDNIFQKGKEK